MNNQPILSVKGVNFSFGKTSVLSNISFELERGDFLALIGPNGSGKTTLIKIILGLLSPLKGEIEICGVAAEHFRCREKIGYVPQKATNFDSEFPATVREVVSMGLIAGKNYPRITSSSDVKLVNEALNTVSMQKFASRRIGDLSGGQQQRVLIARAIVSSPEILFLDEPTAGIDQKAQTDFYNLLNALNKEKNITIVLVTHDVGRVTKYVTKVASLNGDLEFYGSHPEFCAWDKVHHHRSSTEHKLCLHRG